ncbi:MAG: aspartate aminotransferase family protein [Butyricicoccaceae bacterium]
MKPIHTTPRSQPEQESCILNTTGYRLYSAQMSHAAGCYVYDKAGRAYLDLEAGVWALPLGHCHPEVNRALHQQIDCMSHCGYKYSQPIVETCARKLLEITGFDGGKCVFLSSGSEAVEYGMQLACALRPGKKRLCLKHQYFSAYGCSVPDAGPDWVYVEWDDCEAQPVEAYIEQLSAEIDFSQIGVFLFEPGNSSGLVRLPPVNLVAALARLCEAHQVLTVVDEVTCGIGRTGKWFGYMHYPLRPQIVAAGKGLGSGYPVSAVIIDGPTAGDAANTAFHYAQSHQNDPLGCRVAHEVLSVIEKDRLLEASAEKGAYFAKGYRRLQAEMPVITQVRHRGLLLCAELDAGTSPQTMMEIEARLFDRGFIVSVKPQERVIRTYCPLIITEEMIDGYLSALGAVLREMGL